MKKRKKLEKTMSSSTYKKLKKNALYSYGICDICKYHRGCNRRHSHNPNKNWKEYRKHQYKD